MKKNMLSLFMVFVVLVWSVVIISNAFAQQKKGLRFATYDSTAAGKPVCWDTDAKSLTSCGTVTAPDGLSTTGTVTAGAAVLATPLAVTSGGTGTNVLYVTSVSSAPSFTGQFAITGGVGYLATAATVSTDWKQITN